MTDEQIAEIAGKLTEEQRKGLEAVCRMNGGGIRVAVGTTDHNYGTPTTSPWKSLWNKGLIQGKSRHAYMIVHTRLGLAVRNHLENSRVTD